jgi:hypothetical protein
MKSIYFLSSLLTPLTTFAHISYTGRDFGSLVVGNPAVNIVNQTVPSN